MNLKPKNEIGIALPIFFSGLNAGPKHVVPTLLTISSDAAKIFYPHQADIENISDAIIDAATAIIVAADDRIKIDQFLANLKTQADMDVDEARGKFLSYHLLLQSDLNPISKISKIVFRAKLSLLDMAEVPASELPLILELAKHNSLRLSVFGEKWYSRPTQGMQFILANKHSSVKSAKQPDSNGAIPATDDSVDETAEA